MQHFDMVAGARIAIHTITSGKPYLSRIVNMLAILFKDAPVFVDCLRRRFFALMCRYKHIRAPHLIFDNDIFRLNRGQFWIKTRKQFASGVGTIVFEGHKGTTRKKLYMLGLYFGYMHITTGQTRIRVYTSDGRNSYNEKKLETIPDDVDITLGLLQKRGLDYPGYWEPTTKTTANGTVIYKQIESMYKMGRMQNSSGKITFTKIIKL